MGNYNSCELQPKSTCQFDYEDMDSRERKLCLVKPKNQRINSLR